MLRRCWSNRELGIRQTTVSRLPSLGGGPSAGPLADPGGEAATMASRKEDAFEPHDLYLGVGVGKSSRCAVAADGESEVAADRPLPNRKADVEPR